MRHLIASDLRENARLWIWTAVVALVGGACLGTVVVAMHATGEWMAAQPDAAVLSEDLGVMTSMLLGWTGLAVWVVVGSTAGLTVTTQQRGYALWKVLGVPARKIRLVVMTQLSVIGLVSGVLACTVTSVGARAFLPVLDVGVPAGYPTGNTALTAAATVGATVLSCLVGGWRAAKRAASTTEMQALRESGAPEVRVGRAKLTAAVLLLIGAGSLVAVVLTATPAENLEGLTPLFVMLLLMTALLLLGAWTVRGLMFAWTALVPDAAGTAWFAARETCRHRSAISMTTIMPFAIALSLTGVIQGGAGVGHGTVQGFGILVPIFVVSAAGGVANIAMVGRQRNQDAALLTVLGAHPGTVVTAALWEGMTYAFTGILFGLVMTVGTIVVSAPAYGFPIGPELARGPWLMLAGFSAAALALACGTVLWPALTRSRSAPMDALRQPA